jgi:hypothetical protein
MTNAILKALKSSELSLQHTKCQGCRAPASQFKEEPTENNVYELKGKQELGSPNPVYVFYCNDCRKAGRDANPQLLIYEKDGAAYQRPIFNLIDREKENIPPVEPAITEEGKEVKRSTETGKIVSEKKAKGK